MSIATEEDVSQKMDVNLNTMHELFWHQRKEKDNNLPTYLNLQNKTDEVLGVIA